MRGPIDDIIDAPEGQAVAAERREISAGDPRRPPGGKALLRLMQVLESAGYDEAATATVQMATNDEAREEFRSRAGQFSAAPGGGPNGGETKPAARSRRGRAARNDDVEAGAAAEDIAETYRAVGEQLGPPTASGPQWRSIGPWTVPNGQTYGSSRVNVSGRISTIAVDPRDPAHVLIGAANGGVWESRNRGASWLPRTDYAATLTVGALAFDPQNTSIVYCGTGEGNWWWWLGAGILRSSDGGASWSPLVTTPFTGQGFHDLVVNPANSQHLLAATTGGLYVSTDGGTTWTQRRNATTWTLSFGATGRQTEILAACRDGSWQSTDGGTTWTGVALPGAPTTFDRLAIAIAPSNQGVVYAWGAGPPYVGTDQLPTAYLWRRAAGTWTAVATPPTARSGQAWYDWFVAVAPDRDTQVYCGDIEVHRGDLAGTTWTWLNITDKDASGDSIHPDQHAIAFEPGQPDTIYVGNDGGLYRSPDRGITWQHCNNGLVISEFEYLAQDVGSSRWILGGTQDNGTNRWTGSSVWEHVADGDGGDCGVNRADPRTVFHTYYGMSPERSTSAGNFGSWTWIGPPVPDTEGSLFYPPFEASATSGDTIAIGGDRVYVSRNNGTAWTPLAFPSPARSSAMYIPSSNSVYVGTTDGRVFQTTWNGTSWTALAELGTPRAGASVSDIYVEPTNTQRLWVTNRTVGGGRVFRSDDGGATWIDQSAGLPGLPINAIEVDSSNSNRIWVAADLGVYQSFDAGATWADFSSSLPNSFIGDLVFHPHARVLRAGTRNRGVWEIPVDGWQVRPACGVQWTGSLGANERRRWFTFGWPATWHLVWTIMPTSPRPGSPQLTWTVQVERASTEHVTYWITVTNLTPDPLTFEGRYCRLSRY